MTLWFPLQLLMVVEGQSVQDGVLLVVDSRHGALAVDLVYVDLLFSLQHGVPPNLGGLTERELEVKQSESSSVLLQKKKLIV